MHDTETSYDDLPYDDFTFPLTHPEQMACAMRLFGHTPPSITDARVLEIGCASGANLVPMALDLPSATFVGIDLSSAQIATASALVERLALRNIRFEAISLTELAIEPASFDYVICHGVYSWVPPAVRSAILALCARALSPAGVAYVSYNTLPGWAIGRVLRDYLTTHAPATKNATQRLRIARESLAVLVDGLARASEPAALALRHEAETLRDVGDSYLFHEYLETFNEPTYFRDFARAAREAGLAYFCSADLTGFAGMPLADSDRDARIEFEQSIDFVRNRRFRASLLTHHDVALATRPTLDRLLPFHFATRAELTADVTSSALRDDTPMTFVCDGVRVTRSAPIAKAALVALVEAQRRPMDFATLAERCAQLANVSDPHHVAHSLAHDLDLVSLVSDGVVSVHAGPARYAAEAGLQPVACPLARDQASRGAVVTNRRHAQLDVDDLVRELLPLLDGSRDRTALITQLTRPDDANAASLAGRIEGSLDWLALNALLIA